MANSRSRALLQGPWRFALHLVMILFSLRGLTASEIAALFEYDKGVAGLEDRPRSGAPRLGSAGSAGASGCC